MHTTGPRGTPAHLLLLQVHHLPLQCHLRLLDLLEPLGNIEGWCHQVPPRALLFPGHGFGEELGRALPGSGCGWHGELILATAHVSMSRVWPGGAETTVPLVAGAPLTQEAGPLGGSW